MSAAVALPPTRFGRPSLAQRRFLQFMERTGGGWLASDPIEVSTLTLLALERRGYIYLERGASGEEDMIYSALITPLGRAALRWGGAALVTSRRR